MTGTVYTSPPDLVSPVPPLDWPDPLLILRGWLLANIAGLNVVTTTDATFGTDAPSAGMACPLVLLEPVAAGSVDEDDYSMTSVIDVSCFASGHDVRSTWTAARMLSRQVHSLVVRLPGVRTTYGTADEVRVTSTPGEVVYSNPNLVRFLASYEISARAI